MLMLRLQYTDEDLLAKIVLHLMIVMTYAKYAQRSF